MPEIGTTILLAEDDLTLGEMYSERLRHEGFSIVHAKDGQEALDLVETAKPAAIILDIMMPKMNGLDVLKRLKSNQDYKSIPVIIVTALAQEIDQVKEQLGPKDMYLIKSEVMPGDIIEYIKKMVEWG